MVGVVRGSPHPGGHQRGARGDDRSNFLSGLLTDAIVLHCDERYQPCGWTAPLARTVDLKTFQNQTAKPKRLNEKLWHEMLRGKTLNGPGNQPMPSATVAGNFLGRQPGAIEAMGKSVRVGAAILERRGGRQVGQQIAPLRQICAGGENIVRPRRATDL